MPSVRTRSHVPQGERLPEMTTSSAATYPQTQHEQTEGDAYYEQPLTTDSMGEYGNVYRGQVIDRPAPPSNVNANGYVSYGADGAGQPKPQMGVPV